MSNAVIVICGPTATGKSDLAQSLAEGVDGSVLSADSMQVYRGMDIGTAKVPPHLRRIHHFGLDLVDPDEPYSAALYQRYARRVIEDEASSGSPVIMAGGTGLYIQAVIDDLRFPEGGQADNPIRAQYMVMAQDQGAEAVWDALFALDPASAEEIHPHNVKRVVRAIEMHHAGESYHERAHGLTRAPEVIPSVQIGLTMERTSLYERIDARVDRMREQGLEEEVDRLAQAGFASALTARQAIGYNEILEAMAGLCTIDEAFDRIKRSSRRYAKRQLTWFRRDQRIYWIDITQRDDASVLDEATEHLAREAERTGRKL